MVETGTRRLIVMRHAKTAQEASSDRARELTSRGRADAKSAGRWMREEGIEPDLVLVSSAARARATADLVVAELAEAPEVRVVEELYSASAEEVLEIVTGVESTRRAVLVVGHNPTMEEVAQLLPDQEAPEAAAHLPTAGVVVLAVTEDWHRLRAGSAELVSVHVARG